MKKLITTAVFITLMLTFTLPALAANKGTVKIVTDPGDAKIYINGKRKGNSPAEKGQTFAIKLAEGEYIVEAIIPDGAKEHYAKKEIFLAEDSLQTVSLKLTKRTSLTLLNNLKEKYYGKIIEPTMVDIPSGSFKMGCVSGLVCFDSEKTVYSFKIKAFQMSKTEVTSEKTVHSVNIKAFQMGKTEVTFALWDKCVATGGCSYKPKDEGWGRGKRPVINVSYNDIVNEFLPWLNAVTDGGYRLPSEAEWEYAARAGTSTKYSWGNSIDCSKASYDGGKNSNCYYKLNDKYRGTAVVASYAPNAFGLYDMHGNVYEWLADCWNDNYHGAPSDGSVWATGDCKYRLLRGGSWYFDARYLRSAYRDYDTVTARNKGSGFRLSRSK